MRNRILMCGGRKRPQNSKVGAESAPKMSKWGAKSAPRNLDTTKSGALVNIFWTQNYKNYSVTA
ncbi:hypothetical protein BACPEC_03143 [[Bacteroides] pectinophilus ATCC 43243]|uniref:Uncharacterized protein n=1 Tax=[Bacteroides] pectinophilus ATCC 43243 TaxID=483218 RepID=B7AWP3_9FIRM|nr:hypothetical protein BACPEC_03143 [[Bacteroides] pectinophilus ATCC 43243]